MRLLILSSFVFAVAYVSLQSPQSMVSAEQPIEKPATLIVNDSELPTLTANAYGVFDMETGELLLSQNADTPLPIASITKLFTAAAALETSGVDETLKVTLSDVAAEGRAGKLVAGEEYQLRELIFPLLLESSNDAAMVIERNLLLSPVAGVFLDDGSGLSNKNQATVEGLAIAIRNLYQEKPHVFDITRLKQFVGPYTGWVNNSPVRDLPGYRGGKHGYTEAANRTLAAVFAEASLDDRELGYIILGSDNLRADAEELRAFVGRSVQLQ